MVRVETGARLHVGFQNLSLAHDRLYGGVGVALSEPRIVVRITRADTLSCPDDAVRPYARGVLDVLDLPGARIRVDDRFDRHVGLGSGTQLSLACLAGIATAYDSEVDVRELAPELGRGGRSGVGVATFEQGGFVVDAGHPTERFTTRPPDRGDWDIPPVLVRHDVPDSWRFVLVTPETTCGESGESEDESMRSVVERADSSVADDIAAVLTRRLLPAIATEDAETFGRAIDRVGRLNGAWYADEQGGVYRPPAGRLVDGLGRSPTISGVGQSSWGPTVYGVTTASRTATARSDARDVLSENGLDGTVRVVGPRNTGATVDR